MREIDVSERGFGGTPAAIRPRMAAVFALVFLFVVVGGGLLGQVFTSSIDFGSIAALVTFLALSWGVFFGLFKMAKGWEGEAKH